MPSKATRFVLVDHELTRGRYGLGDGRIQVVVAVEEGTVQLRGLFFQPVRARPKVRLSRHVAERVMPERLESRQLLAVDSAGFRSDLLANSETVFIDAAAVGPAPIIFSQSTLAASTGGEFVVSAVASGVVEKWLPATERWVDVSALPTSSNPAVLLQLLANRTVTAGDRLRWVPDVYDVGLQKAFEVIGWDSNGSESPPIEPGAPGPVTSLSGTVLSERELLVSWEPPAGDAVITGYTVTQTDGTTTQRFLVATNAPVRLSVQNPAVIQQVSVTANTAAGSGESETMLLEPWLFERFAEPNYIAVTTAIWNHHNELPQGFQLSEPVVDPSDPEGRVKMSYMFNWQDAQFGQGGHMPLLTGKTVGDPANHFYTVDTGTIGQSGTVRQADSQDFNIMGSPWLSVDGDLRAYLDARADTFDLTLPPTDASELNAWQRAAAVLGMTYDVTQQDPNGYSNNYVVTFLVDQDAFFRPNLNQAVTDQTAASPPFVLNDEGHYAPPVDFEGTPWLPTLDAEVFDGSGALLATFGDFYAYWWRENVQEPSASGAAGFPWTGVGYTYDWYYQDRSQWADGQGVGVAEFVLVPSTPSNVWSIEIVDVQTTAEYLGSATPWPGVSITE